MQISDLKFLEIFPAVLLLLTISSLTSYSKQNRSPSYPSGSRTNGELERIDPQQPNKLPLCEDLKLNQPSLGEDSIDVIPSWHNYTSELIDECEPDEEVNGVCVNPAPPAPTISRYLFKPGICNSSSDTCEPGNPVAMPAYDHFSHELPDDQKGQYKTLPYFRPTMDGRVYLHSARNWFNFPVHGMRVSGTYSNSIPSLYYYDPFAVGADLKLNNYNSMASGYPIHPIVYTNMHPQHYHWDIPENYKRNRFPGTYHMEICNDSGSVTQAGPRSCFARKNNNSPQPQVPGKKEGDGQQLDPSQANTVHGDCYDVTLIFHQEAPDGRSMDIISNPVTIFVRDPKNETKMGRIYLYPRTTEVMLPALSEVEDLQSIGNPDDNNKYNLQELAVGCYETNGDTPSNIDDYPLYCQFFYNQKRMANVQIQGKHYQRGNIPNMFEPTITADGKLLLVNLGFQRGLVYSYNNQGACRADGFDEFKNISEMPFDPKIYQNYPIGMNQRKNGQSQPFKDSLGNVIAPGEQVEGAYMWIDRLGRNIFFAGVNHIQDQYKDKQGQPMDTAPGKGYMAVGAWTNGKMIALDGVLNIFDFGQRPSTSPSHSKMFEAEFYQGSATPMRPIVSSMVGSIENQFHHFDALSPTLPFDTVWQLSSDIERNAQIFFDDYMIPNALIIAHMNAAIARENEGHGSYFYFKNGYRPKHVWRLSTQYDPNRLAEFSRVESPVLQNAATHEATPSGTMIPTQLHLGGGARIEPIAMGGVYGKGVYLDGDNDYISSEISAQSENNYVISLWLQLENFNQRKSLFTFPDGSRIDIDHNFLYAVAFDHEGEQDTLNLKSLSLAEGEFFHLALAISTNQLESQRDIIVYINGNPIRSIRSDIKGKIYAKDRLAFKEQKNGIYPFSLLPGEFALFTVGNPYVNGVSIRGWVDELRVYEFNGNNNLTNPIPKFFDEYICNQAFGSSIEVDLQSMPTTAPTLFPNQNSIMGQLRIKGIRSGLLATLSTSNNTFLLTPQDSPDQDTSPNDTGSSLDNQGVNPSQGQSHVNISEKLTHSAHAPHLAQSQQQCIDQSGNIIAMTIEQGGTNISSAGESTPSTTTASSFNEEEHDDSAANMNSHETKGYKRIQEQTKAILCEQMVIGASQGNNEMADQHHQTLCAARVYQSHPHPSCRRSEVLEKKHLKLQAGTQRPDFSQVGFCLLCHIPQHPLPSLGVSALTSNNSFERQQDFRRQPMDWVNTIYGQPLKTDNNLIFPNAKQNPKGWELDWELDFHHKIPGEN